MWAIYVILNFIVAMLKIKVSETHFSDMFYLIQYIKDIILSTCSTNHISCAQ